MFKNIKAELSLLGLLVAGSLTSTATADIRCLAPGFGGTDFILGSNDTWVDQTHNLGHYWRYKITGIQYKLTAAARYDGAVWKGQLVQGLHGNEKRTPYPGTTGIWVRVNNTWILHTAFLEASYVSDTSGIVTHYFDPPLEYTDESVSIRFAYYTNMRGSDDVVRVLGESVTSPPVPTGDISAPNVVRTGTSPFLDWSLTRVSISEIVTALAEDGSETTDSSDNSDEQETDNNPIDETDTEDGSGTTTDPIDSGSGSNNNGHGNNVDGVDISNPGKSAQKWEDKWGIIDTSAPDDDEGSGGGSAVSHLNG